MQVRVLGPLELLDDDGRRVSIGGIKERSLLALLALHANEVVSEDRLIDSIWGDDPPRTATRTLQTYMSRLRRVIGDCGGAVSLESHKAGWALRLGPGALDLGDVEGLVVKARQASAEGDPIGAALAYADALRAWRGRPLDEFIHQPWAALESNRLIEHRQNIVEERIDAELGCGRHAAMVAELEALCGQYPLRERLWGQRMIALYRSGRQAEALRVYQQLRTTLSEELGIDPSPAAARIEEAILRQDPALEWRGTATTDPGAAVAISGVATLVFTDIVASTELLQRLGDDRFDALRRQHFSMLRETIAGAGGAEVKSLGDGLMVAFASSIDAITCGIAIQRAVARRNRRSSDDRIDVRVGVHAGEAILEGGDYYGSAVVTARRLCDAAGPGQILVSRLVTELIGSRGAFEFSPRDPMELKGIHEPMVASVVVWTEEGRHPLPPALVGHRASTFVGRDEEIAQLDRAWAAVQTGDRQVVLIAGEPGIGKTTLAQHVTERAWAQGACVLFGRCDEESVVAFQPFVEAFSHYATVCAPAELRDQLGTQAADLALLVPGLGRRLPELANVAATGGESERFRMFEAVSSLVATMSADAPVVLVLDDLHWADRPTLQLLVHLMRRSSSVPLLVVGTYRDTDLVRTHPLAETLVDLRRTDLVQRLALRGLSREAVLLLVIGDNAATPADVALGKVLWTETEGSPLFLREILRHLEETDGIAQEDGRWVVRRPIDALGIPEGIREVIGRRLTRLSDNANTTLRVGSVMGRELRLDVLEAIGDLTTDQLIDALDEATAAGVVAEEGGGAGRWSYTHALVRQALYDELSLTRRVRLHQRVGEALEALHGTGDGAHLAELAFHFTQASVAGNADKAIDYSRRAGSYAVRISAYEQGARHFAAAVEVAEDSRSEDTTLVADLLIAQADAQTRSGDPPAARETLERVVALVGTTDAERLARAALAYFGDDVRTLWAEIGRLNERGVELLERALSELPTGDSVVRARVTASLAKELYFAPGTTSRRAELAETALAMARRLGDKRALIFVLHAVQLGVYGPDNVEERFALAEECQELARELGDPSVTAFGLVARFSYAFELGRMDIVRADMDAALAVIAATRSPYDRQQVTTALACLAMIEGRFDDGEELAMEAMAIGQEVRDRNTMTLVTLVLLLRWVFEGRIHEMASAFSEMFDAFPLLRGVADVQLLVLLAHSGRVDEARHLAAAFDPLDPQQLDRSAMWLFLCAELADAYSVIGERDRASRLYDALLPYQHRPAAALVVAYGPVDLALARCAVAAGQADIASAHFERAIATCEEHGWMAIGPQAQVEYAAILAGREDARAQALASAALAVGGELGLRRVIRDASGVLGRDSGLDPDPTPRRTDRARARLARTGQAGMLRWTRGLSDDDLVRRLGSRAGLRALMSAMTKAFQPAMAFGFQGEIEFELRPPAGETDVLASDWWTLTVGARKATSRRGRATRPTVTLHLGLSDFVRIAAGRVHPTQLFIDMQATIEGKVEIAARLGDMFGFGTIDPALLDSIDEP